MGRGGPGGPGGRGPGDGGGRGGGRGAPSGGPGTNDPTRVRFNFATLKSMVVYAYGLKAYQVSGPGWIDTERYDIEGRMPADTTQEQMIAMLQNLLAERFGLKVHREKKDLPEYSMVVAKSGVKMKESAPPPPQAEQQAQQQQGPPPMPGRGDMKFDSDGFPIFPAGMGPGRGGPGGRGGLGMMMAPGNRARIMGTQAQTQDLADRLTEMLSRPVTDGTGLTKKYDITLTFSTEGLNLNMGGRGGFGPGGPGGPGGGPGGGPEGMQPQGDPPPDLFAAIQGQLGLRLDAKKGGVDLLVIDHAEKAPVEN